MRVKRIISFSLIAGALYAIWRWLSGNSSQPSPGKNITTIASNAKETIVGILTKNGYSQQMANNWFLIANMETAGFTSRLFSQYHNPWGMKQPKTRQTNSVGPIVLSGSSWAAYMNLDQAVIDLIFYMEEFKYPNDLGNLDEQLRYMKQKGYFEESLERYRDLVIAWANKYGYSY